MSKQSQISNLKSRIVIVGAGPAGASLAIRLVKENHRVCLVERERFPRPKLCGEFISPECLPHFRDLGVFDEMLAAGGTRIQETVFYATGGRSVGIPSEWFNKSESGALSLSRAAMDLRLLERAKSVGVEVTEDCSAINLLHERNQIGALKIRDRNGETREIAADLFVDATGRARVLGKLAERQRSETAKTQRFQIQNPKSKIQNRLVGFKAHLENVNLDKNVCEIYFFPGGYGGLSRVENNLANFCFLMRAETVREFGSDARQIVEKVVWRNKRAAFTLENAEPVHDWLAVAVDRFGANDLNPAANLFAVGDAGAFVDPFTGSGMLMAFESAEILAHSITDNSTVEQIAEQYKIRHARRFQRRLFICSLMRRAAFAPNLAKTLIAVLSCGGDLPRKILARATRPSVSVSKQ